MGLLGRSCWACLAIARSGLATNLWLGSRDIARVPILGEADQRLALLAKLGGELGIALGFLLSASCVNKWVMSSGRRHAAGESREPLHPTPLEPRGPSLWADDNRCEAPVALIACGTLQKPLSRASFPTLRRTSPDCFSSRNRIKPGHCTSCGFVGDVHDTTSCRAHEAGRRGVADAGCAATQNTEWAARTQGAVGG